MVLSHPLPEDSVLRRHALSELQRVLGLPPTDSVLRRHYEQLQEMQAAAAPAMTATRPAATPPRAATAPATATAAAAVHAAAPSQPAAVRPAAAPTVAPIQAASKPAAPSGGGGLFGWLKRLLGA